MTGLTFGDTRLGQRVIGNKVTGGYEMPEGWVDSAPAPTWSGKTTQDKTCVLLLMQPDKALDLKPSQCPTRTYIRDFKKTEELVEVLQKLSVEDLQALMGVGKKIAKSHLERFQNFQRFPAKQACLMLGGEALAAADFSGGEQRFADAHLRIASGLYGLLRPFDDVKPVRDVPMGGRLSTKRGSTVVAFWADSLTKQLAKDAQELARRDGEKVLLVACLTDEYWAAVQASVLPSCVELVRLSFLGATEEQVRRARGLFARHVVQKRACDLEGLQDFSHDDWDFDRLTSREAKLVFRWDGDASGACAPKLGKKGTACDPGYHSSGTSGAEEEDGAETARGRSQSAPPRERSRSRSRGRSRTPVREGRRRSPANAQVREGRRRSPDSLRRTGRGRPSRRRPSSSRSRDTAERRRGRR